MERHTYAAGIIGNCSYIAHIHKDTNVNWLCWPRFDSSFVFGSLLDAEKGGDFYIRPEEKYESSQYYLENTNILCTEITTAQGSYRITDFAPRFYQYGRHFKPLMLIRKIEPIEGLARVHVHCRPVYNFGSCELKDYRGSNHIEFVGCGDDLRLTTNIPINYLIEDTYFIINETKYLILTYGEPLEASLSETAETFLIKTIQYWRNWIKESAIVSFYQPFIIRSALVLKIHQYEDTGAIIAASTTSLPESPGSGRNWDYRYCWLRDTYYVITALSHICHFEEMERYFHYVTDISFSEEDRFQPLYGITGAKHLTEKVMEDLSGYLGNKPVRVGNQAYEHVQNDIYGQVLISLLPLYTDHRFIFMERKDSADWLRTLLDRIRKTIDEEDAGIWEFRNFEQVHCYTNLFQWAGCCAAEKMAKVINNKELEEQALELKSRAAAHIESCYDPERKVYTTARGNPNLDASTLQLIIMNYLDPTSQKAKDHLIALEANLRTPKGLFYRYRHADDFGEPKTTFLICAFWYVEALACVGRLDDAIKEFRNLMQYSNHLLLFSEDVDEDNGSQWGNFPQAYSHVGLMNAAYKISMKLDVPIFLDRKE